MIQLQIDIEHLFQMTCEFLGAQGAHSALSKIVGKSEAILALRKEITRAAPTMAPILLQGETGTGKEVVARSIHACSKRARGPFIAVNCSAIPSELLEAEFFGVRRGAFSGAIVDRPGFFKAAAGGTLFLDEIGDLPLLLQPKLLRCTQERVIRPLGGIKEEAIDVRLISASHKDLEQEAANGRFRLDLFYRLAVIKLQLPTIRERREDLPAICNSILENHRLKNGPYHSLSKQELSKLSGLPLMGNVRELENIILRSIALNDGAALRLDLPKEINLKTPFVTEHIDQWQLAASDAGRNSGHLKYLLDVEERNIIFGALKQFRYNRQEAASALGITPEQLRYRMTRLGIRAPRGPRGKNSNP